MIAEWNKRTRKEGKISGPSERAEKDLEYEGSSNTSGHWSIRSNTLEVKERITGPWN